MHSSAACASCAMTNADKSSYSVVGTLHPYHITSLAHRSLAGGKMHHCKTCCKRPFCMLHYGTLHYIKILSEKCKNCTSVTLHLLHTFLPIALKPSIDLELEYIFGKPMKYRFQRYFVHMQLLSTFHAGVKYISGRKC